MSQAPTEYELEPHMRPVLEVSSRLLRSVESVSVLMHYEEGLD